MKCGNCGFENNENVPYCYQCGQQLTNDTKTTSEESNLNQNNQYDFNPIQQEYVPPSYQSNPNQISNMGQKSMFTSLFLAIVPPLFISALTGLGHYYLGLKRRFYYIIGIGIIITMLNVLFTLLKISIFKGIISIILIIWWILAIYDTYKCTKAVNNNEDIPLFLGLINMD